VTGKLTHLVTSFYKQYVFVLSYRDTIATLKHSSLELLSNNSNSNYFYYPIYITPCAGLQRRCVNEVSFSNRVELKYPLPLTAVTLDLEISSKLII